MENQNDITNRNDRRVRLRVLGISYSQIQSGAYALILAQVDGPYRIPVVVGAAEAQSIAMKMEGVRPPRPMTHDLFASLAQAFGVVLKEVFIHKFEDGIFSSELTFVDHAGVEAVLDARTSDAIAIAMRTGTPIFTTRAILAETGFIMDIKDPADDITTDSDADNPASPPAPKPENMAVEELKRELARHIENEEYEEAAKIQAIINAKTNRPPAGQASE